MRAAPDDREYFDAAMRPSLLRRVAEDKFHVTEDRLKQELRETEQKLGELQARRQDHDRILPDARAVSACQRGQAPRQGRGGGPSVAEDGGIGSKRGIRRQSRISGAGADAPARGKT